MTFYLAPWSGWVGFVLCAGVAQSCPRHSNSWHLNSLNGAGHGDDAHR